MAAKKKLIRCQNRPCRNTFAARFAGQKSGHCDACNAERRRLRQVHSGRPTARAGLTDEENELLRRLERLTHRVCH